ncbi:Sensor protein PhoQ [hydrothermal vent metagenome]|uniref:histidine kinase n=1 Tax=hydrothermal vent metagenome TaxID=652676 RepID=A0A3B0TIG5_9ZZZZ
MKIRSLRLRLMISATGAILLALTIAGFGMVALFERHVERRIGSELDTYLNQIAARTIFDADGTASLSGKLADPRFDQVYSGLYWQIADETANNYTRSRSLWDVKLDLPPDVPTLGVIDVHDVDGPQGTRLRAHERRLIFDTGQGEKILRLTVAIDNGVVANLSADFAAEVTLSLLLLAAFLIVAGWVQINVGLRPLSAIRRGLTAIASGKTKRLAIDGLSEIAPLVEEVNSLLDVQDDAMARARDRAADLAHGFKTPLTALLADAARLRGGGNAQIADEIERTVTRMRGHIERELTRSRLRNTLTTAAIELAPVVQGLIDTLKRTPGGEHIDFELRLEAGLTARIEHDDLNEILGNLLENAVRHARGKVRLVAARAGAGVGLDIEDDGPGIASAHLKAATDRGKRLDSSSVGAGQGSGAGLGLAIVCDVLDHYGQNLTLNRSDLGGLKASFELAG